MRQKTLNDMKKKIEEIIQSHVTQEKITLQMR